MARVLLPPRGPKWPYPSQRLNPASPLYRPGMRVWFPGSPIDRVGSPSVAPAAGGVAFVGSSSASNLWQASGSKLLSNRDVFTLIAFARSTQGVTPGGWCVVGERGASGNDIFKITAGENSYNASQFGIVIRNTAGTLERVFNSGAASIFDGRVHMAAAVKRAANDIALVVDGVQEASTSASFSGSGFTGSTPLTIANDIQDAKAFDGVLLAIAVPGFAYSIGELKELYRNPWQLFEPQRIWVPVSAGGGGATESRTVSVSGVGDAAWQATAINAQTIASAGVGAASWQGVAITARQLASDGVAAASWQGGAVVGQTIASAGVAAVAFDGVALAPASLSAAGSAAASWQATSIAAATVASAGQASAAWQSVWVHQQAFSSAGVAAASWVGTDASGGTTIEPRTIASAGVGSATWQASVVAAADLVSDGIGAAAWQAAARVVAAFTSAGSSAFAPESARIDVRTLTAAGVGAAAFDGQDAGTVEARTFSSGGAASVSFAVEGEPERAHGFEIGPATTKPKRRGLVVVDETEEKPARQKITKRDIDRRVFERAREEARAVIAKAAEQHATTQHVKAERFAQVRTALKPLAKAIGDWNWIAVYQRMYQQALDEQIRQELAREDAIAAEAQAAEEADERELMNLIMEWM